MLYGLKGAKALARMAVVFASLAMLPGCGTVYIDSGLQDLKPGEKAAAAHPQPVQLLFEFQTKGVPNGQAADKIRGQVTDAVQASGLFSTVSTDPVSSGALLHIVINNVPLNGETDQTAYDKGFKVGFTFGLVGDVVGDGYICTADYQPDAKAKQISASSNDAIYMKLGNTDDPPHADKVASIDDAVKLMVSRVVSHALNDLAKDPSFNGAASVPIAVVPISQPAQPAAPGTGS